MLAATLGGCGSRGRDLLRQKSKSRGLAIAPLQPVPGVRPARAGCRAVRDSTLVAWYRSVYAPRTGGAYDSHHRTAEIAGCPRRRGGRVADYSAAGNEVASDRHPVTWQLPPRTARTCGGSDRWLWVGDRAALTIFTQTRWDRRFSNVRRRGSTGPSASWGRGSPALQKWMFGLFWGYSQLKHVDLLLGRPV